MRGAQTHVSNDVVKTLVTAWKRKIACSPLSRGCLFSFTHASSLFPVFFKIQFKFLKIYLFVPYTLLCKHLQFKKLLHSHIFFFYVTMFSVRDLYMAISDAMLLSTTQVPCRDLSFWVYLQQAQEKNVRRHHLCCKKETYNLLLFPFHPQNEYCSCHMCLKTKHVFVHPWNTPLKRLSV